MTHKLEVATNAAASTWQDITGVVDWETAVFGGHGYDGEVGVGSGFNLIDDSAAYTLSTRRVVRLTETATTPASQMFRGRIVSTSLSRGTLLTGDARQFDVSLADYNQDLQGIVVDRWSRPAETDRARYIALHNAFLNGSPRTSTNLASTYVPNTNTVTMAKKVYEATDPLGVVHDLIQQSGKTSFITADGAEFYDLPTSTAYASTIGISDVNPDYSTIFPPLRSSTSRDLDASELFTGATLIKTNGVRIAGLSAGAESAHDYWRTVIHDDDVTHTTSAQALAAYIAEYAKDDIGYRTAIILPANRVDAIKWGMTINFRSAAAGVLSPIGVRIVRLMWYSLPDGTYRAELELDYPMKVNPKRPKGTIAATKAAAKVPIPATALLSGSLSLDPFADDVRPVPIVAATPTLPDNYYPPGSTVSLTADGKIYRNVADVWVKDVDGGDVVVSTITTTKIADDAITTPKIFANAVTADKLSIGSRHVSLVPNPSFEDAGASAAIAAGWALTSATGDGTFVREVTTNAKDGGAVATLYASTGANSVSCNSAQFPVVAGEVLFVSTWYRATATITTGVYVRLTFFDSAAAYISDLNILTNAAASSTWAEARGYITVPAGAVKAYALLTNYQPSSSAYVNFDAVLVQRMAGGVRNSTAETIIDAAGITVINGKITVANAGAVVIIDGTSNMFKIAATGTQATSSFSNPGNPGATVTVTLSTGFTYVPACLLFVIFASSTEAYPLPKTTLDNSGTGLDWWEGRTDLFNTNQTKVYNAVSSSRGTGTTSAYTFRYYVLKETVI